jgi:hypothetical protein
MNRIHGGFGNDHDPNCVNPMKPFLMLMGCLLSTALLAQSWCPPGANFKYNHQNYAIGNGYFEVDYLKDTTVVGRPAKLLHLLFRGPGSGSPSLVDSLFTAESNGLVTILNAANQWDTLFDWNASIGQQWRLHQSASAMNTFCDVPSKATAVDTGSRTVLGVTLRYVVVDFDYGLNFNGQATDTIFERIGPRATFLLPFAECWSEGSAQSLRCYEDDAFGPYLFQWTGDCEALSLNESPTTAQLIYPNPVQTTLRVPVAEPTPFSVYSQVGERVLEGYTEGAIQVDHLQPVIYVLKLANHVQRFIKE